MRKLQRFCPFSIQFCLFSINIYYSDNSYCRSARLCRALEEHWRPDTSHCPTAMTITTTKTTMSTTMIFWGLSPMRHMSCFESFCKFFHAICIFGLFTISDWRPSSSSELVSTRARADFGGSYMTIMLCVCETEKDRQTDRDRERQTETDIRI